MSLPRGFQPRPCPFCGSRHLINGEIEGDPKKFKVTCVFCGSAGPARSSNDDAWISWNGDGVIAPAMFGSSQEVF